MATNPTKLDYSRLLDDEFLNRGERVRVHTVTRGAATVLGSSASLEWRDAQGVSARCTTALLKAALALALMAALTFVALLIMAHQQHSHLRVLAMPVQAEAAGAAQARPSLLEHGEKGTTLHDFVLHGGFESSLEDEEHPHDIHDHVLPGDVVVEDHHIVSADEPEPTRHAVVVCLPLAIAKHVPTSTATPVNAHNATDSTASFPLHLSRHQRDVVQSVTEYLSASARCHVVVLRGVDDEEATASTTASTASTAATGSPSAAGMFGHFSHSGCGAWSGEDEDAAGAEHGGTLALPGGKVVPVVLWDAPALFARSPLAEVWRDLHWRKAKGASAASSAIDVLDLAARLQLLWRYGGVSVDLQSSADQVLKTLSAFNRTDSSHVYLETTRGTLIAAPQTCNAVVFDLIQAIARHARHFAPPQDHPHYDDADLRVFDGVLNDYCRSKRTTRHESTTPAASDVPPSFADHPSSTAASTATASGTTASTTPSSVSSAPTTTRSLLLARMKGVAAFGQLRAGPPPASTTPHPEPEDIHLDTTRCRGNLVAISLS
ncbi:uncharacterized protein LOC117645872 [Thrips palmi]|uniref:Uncharacterized protein LOC117645872 n=1 Tax=Thrips palmi TaxID=161013 RepID=A0A6P8YYG1_THRPL|nr:uncharacterized protein LOC117645872 [Thrips palmi]